MQPLARKEKVTIRELPEETLVYDLERHTLHCLNRTAALVWKHCDGHHDPAALAVLVGRELGLPAEEAEAAARLALEQLSRRHLLHEKVAPAPEEERVTRRTALRKIAVAAAAALPVVMTLKSPSVAWAGGIGGCFPNPCPAGETCFSYGNHSSSHSCSGSTSSTTTTTTTTKPPCGGEGSACSGNTCCPGCICLAGACSC